MSRSSLRRALPGLMRLLLALLLAVPSGLLSDGGRPALAAPGDLDPSFDGDGIVVSGMRTDSVAAVAVQPDGKIVAAAFGRASIPGETVFAVQRFLADGRLDPAFGAGGTVLTGVGAGGASVYALALQADGKIVAGGRAVISNPDGSFSDVAALVRYTPDGQLDTGFGSGGKVLTAAGPTSFSLNAVAIQADGKILAAGNRYPATCWPPPCGPLAALVRFNPDGSVDGSFGSGGGVFPSRILGAGQMVVQADGKIVVGPLPARFNSDGSFDGSFGSAGVVQTGIGGALALQADGKIVVAGRDTRPQSGSVLARYTPSGNLDPTFGVDGYVFLEMHEPSFVPDPSAVVVQADGKIVVAGLTETAGTKTGGLVLGRYTPSGSPDSAFGVGGAVTTTSPVGGFGLVGAPTSGSGTGLALQPDGKVVAATIFAPSAAPGGYFFALARYQAALDPGVGGRGFRIGSDWVGINGRVTLGWAAGTDQAGYLLARSPSAAWPLPADVGGYVDANPAQGPALNCYQLFALGTSAVLAASDVLCVQRGLFNQGNLLNFILRLDQSATTRMTWRSLSSLPSLVGYVLLALPQGGAPRAQVLAASATAVDDPTGGVPTCYVLYAVYESDLNNTDLTCALPGHSSFGAASPAAQRATAAGPQAAARTAAESLTGRAAAAGQDVTTKLPAGRVKVEEAAAQLRTKQQPRPPRRGR